MWNDEDETSMIFIENKWYIAIFELYYQFVSSIDWTEIEFTFTLCRRDTAGEVLATLLINFTSYNYKLWPKSSVWQERSGSL
jgi:hypothetical protein